MPSQVVNHVPIPAKWQPFYKAHFALYSFWNSIQHSFYTIDKIAGTGTEKKKASRYHLHFEKKRGKKIVIVKSDISIFLLFFYTAGLHIPL